MKQKAPLISAGWQKAFHFNHPGKRNKSAEKEIFYFQRFTTQPLLSGNLKTLNRFLLPFEILLQNCFGVRPFHVNSSRFICIMVLGCMSIMASRTGWLLPFFIIGISCIFCISSSVRYFGMF